MLHGHTFFVPFSDWTGLDLRPHDLKKKKKKTEGSGASPHNSAATQSVLSSEMKIKGMCEGKRSQSTDENESRGETTYTVTMTKENVQDGSRPAHV